MLPCLNDEPVNRVASASVDGLFGGGLTKLNSDTGRRAFDRLGELFVCTIGAGAVASGPVRFVPAPRRGPRVEGGRSGCVSHCIGVDGNVET